MQNARRRRWALVLLVGVPGLLFTLIIVAFQIGTYRLGHTLGYSVHVNLPDGFSGCADLRFEVPDAPTTRAEQALYVVDLPADGRWYSSTKLNWGEGLRFRYYAPTPKGWREVEPRMQTGATITIPMVRSNHARLASKTRTSGRASVLDLPARAWLVLPSSPPLVLPFGCPTMQPTHPGSRPRRETAWTPPTLR
jgi:hypothetical protein